MKLIAGFIFAGALIAQQAATPSAAPPVLKKEYNEALQKVSYALDEAERLALSLEKQRDTMLQQMKTADHAEGYEIRQTSLTDWGYVPLQQQAQAQKAAAQPVPEGPKNPVIPKPKPTVVPPPANETLSGQQPKKN